MEKKDSFVEEIRGNVDNKDILTRHFGFYKAKEVDRFASQMQDRIRNMETVYQERFDDQRMSLLAVTRDRDELIKRIHKMEQEMVTPESWEASITEQGMICVAADKYKEALENAAALSEEKISLAAENEQLTEKNTQLMAHEEQTEQLRQQIMELQVQIQRQSEEVNLAKTDNQVLLIKNQQGQDSVRQLREEIRNTQKESIVRLQYKELQCRQIVDRCEGVLHGHQKLLQQLQQSFTSSTDTIEELCENIFPAKDTDGNDMDDKHDGFPFGKRNDRPTIRIS